MKHKDFIPYQTKGDIKYANEAPWKFWAPSFAITDNIYYVGNDFFSSHLVKTSKGLILIDTPAYLQTSYLLTESIREVGFDPHDIKWIFNTHAHYDHVGCTRILQEHTGAKIALGINDKNLLEEADRFLSFEVDNYLTHKEVFEFGDTRIICHSTPGHTPGTMSFTFNTTINGCRYKAGIFGGPGLNTLKKEGYGYKGNFKDFEKTLEYLEKLNFEIWLGAHPFVNKTFEKYYQLKKGKEPNPFIDKKGRKKFLKDLKVRLEKLKQKKIS